MPWPGTATSTWGNKRKASPLLSSQLRSKTGKSSLSQVANTSKGEGQIKIPTVACRKGQMTVSCRLNLGGDVSNHLEGHQLAQLQGFGNWRMRGSKGWSSGSKPGPVAGTSVSAGQESTMLVFDRRGSEKEGRSQGKLWRSWPSDLQRGSIHDPSLGAPYGCSASNARKSSCPGFKSARIWARVLHVRTSTLVAIIRFLRSPSFIGSMSGGFISRQGYARPMA